MNGVNDVYQVIDWLFNYMINLHNTVIRQNIILSIMFITTFVAMVISIISNTKK